MPSGSTRPCAASRLPTGPRGGGGASTAAATSRFRPSRKRVPNSSRVPEFQAVVDRYVEANELDGLPRPESSFRVLDVARKKGSGTAGLGLDRSFVLVQGWSADPGCPTLHISR